MHPCELASSGMSMNPERKLLHEEDSCPTMQAAEEACFGMPCDLEDIDVSLGSAIAPNYGDDSYESEVEGAAQDSEPDSGEEEDVVIPYGSDADADEGENDEDGGECETDEGDAAEDEGSEDGSEYEVGSS